MNDLLILSTLLAGPQHGYALKKQVGLITGQGDLHNNLIYPLLKRFVDRGWVTRRKSAGQRGQTRDVYSLSPKGRIELLAKLSVFSEKEAGNREECLLRVGLFSALDQEVRLNVIEQRDRWLAARQNILANLLSNMNVGDWGGQAVEFLRSDIRLERKWLAGLRSKVSPQARKPSRLAAQTAGHRRNT